jgi:hypothetical protein
MYTFAENRKAARRATSAKSTLPGQAHFGHGRELNSPLHLQRPAGDHSPGGLKTASGATSQRSSGHDFSHIPVHARPPVKIRPRLSTFSIDGRAARDKITQKNQPKSDQSIGNMSVATTAKGLDVSADADGLYSSPDYPDGFRWLQTVTTNDPSDTPVGAPLLPVPITYVDPRPNDDTKPFYWTDAEEAANVGHFEDTPGRPAHPTGIISWQAILSLGGVNNKAVTRFDSVSYGFSIDTAGTVTMSGPSTPGDLTEHLGTLSGSFPGWTFT